MLASFHTCSYQVNRLPFAMELYFTVINGVGLMGLIILECYFVMMVNRGDDFRLIILYI